MNDRPDFESGDVVFEEDRPFSRRKIITKEVSYDFLVPLINRKLNSVLTYLANEGKLTDSPEGKPESAAGATMPLYAGNASGGFCLVSRETGDVHEISGMLRVGRNRSFADLAMPLEMTVSQEHAQLIEKGGALLLKDLESSNGTFVNGRKIMPGFSVEVVAGDVIGFADKEYVVEKK